MPFIYKQLIAGVVTLTATIVQPTSKETEEPTLKKPKKKRSKIDEMKEYFTERDNTSCSAQRNER